MLPSATANFAFALLYWNTVEAFRNRKMKRLLNTKEAAEYLGVTVRTVQKYKATGMLAFVQYSPGKKGSFIQFKKETLDRFIDQHEHQVRPFEAKQFKPSKPKLPVSMVEHERAKANLAKLGFTTG